MLTKGPEAVAVPNDRKLAREGIRLWRGEYRCRGCFQTAAVLTVHKTELDAAYAMEEQEKISEQKGCLSANCQQAERYYQRQKRKWV